MSRGAIFITGASSGIGRATAERLARAGYDVIPGIRRPDALPEPIKEPVTIDLADSSTIGPATQQVLERAAGNLVGVINNAGYTVSGPCEAVDVDDWRAQFEVNLFGHIAVTRALLPALLQTKGRVINVGSIGGRMASPFIAPYNSSKFAVRAWTDGMRMELAPHGVHVVLIEPGSIDTPLWEKGNELADEQLDKLTDEQKTRYSAQIAGARKAADWAASHGIPADKCAQVIEQAMTSSRPRGRYLVGSDARMQAMFSMLPVAVSDRVMGFAIQRLSKSS
jgi:NAD(P)-dependent dehydrogenase (short-subunit alcohol dehydrogenase family)